MAEDISGVLQFGLDLEGRSLILGGDCAGETLEFSSDGVTAQVALPYFERTGEKTDFRHKQLFCDKGFWPEVFIDPQNEFHSEIPEFGYPYLSTPEGNLSGFVVQRFLVKSKTAIPIEKAESFTNSTRKVLSKMIEWLEVLTFEDSTLKLVSLQHSPILLPHFVSPEGVVNAVHTGPLGMTTVLLSDDVRINLDLLKLASQLAQEGRDPDPIHTLLLSALRYRNRKAYRQSVLDSATAVEMALVRIAESHFSCAPAKLQDWYSKQYRRISDRFKDIESFGFEMPFQLKKLSQVISKPRNNAIHEGAPIGKDEANRALSFAKDLIYGQFPPEHSR